MENLEENPFYRKLLKSHGSLFRDIQSACHTLCVPSAKSLTPKMLSSTDFFHTHILKPSPYLLDHFETLNGRTVHKEGAKLITGEGFQEKGSIRINFEEVFYNKQDKFYRVYVTEGPLDGKRFKGLPQKHPDGVINYHTLSNSLAEFLIDPKYMPVIMELKAEIREFNRTYVFVKGFETYAEENIASIFARGMKMLEKTNSELAMVRKNNITQYSNICQVMESFIMKGVHGKVFDSLCQLHTAENERYVNILEKFSNISPLECGIPEAYWCQFKLVVNELSLLSSLGSPLEKLYCIRECARLITLEVQRRQNVNASGEEALTTDDFVSIFVFVLPRAHVSNIHSNIVYIQHFHRRDIKEMASFNSELDYYFSNFRAALLFLENLWKKSGPKSSTSKLTPSTQKSFVFPNQEEKSEQESVKVAEEVEGDSRNKLFATGAVSEEESRRSGGFSRIASEPQSEEKKYPINVGPRSGKKPPRIIEATSEIKPGIGGFLSTMLNQGNNGPFISSSRRGTVQLLHVSTMTEILELRQRIAKEASKSKTRPVGLISSLERGKGQEPHVNLQKQERKRILEPSSGRFLSSHGLTDYTKKGKKFFKNLDDAVQIGYGQPLRISTRTETDMSSSSGLVETGFNETLRRTNLERKSREKRVTEHIKVKIQPPTKRIHPKERHEIFVNRIVDISGAQDELKDTKRMNVDTKRRLSRRLATLDRHSMQNSQHNCILNNISTTDRVIIEEESEESEHFNVQRTFDSKAVLFTYKCASTKEIVVTGRQLHILQQKEWLDDILIDFYVMYIFNSLNRDMREKFYFFSSLFYTRLDSVKGNFKTKYEKSKHWTRNIDIFSKDYVILPVNRRSHWCLLVIYYLSDLRNDDVSVKRTSLHYLDSSDILEENPIVNRVSRYLEHEWNEKSRASGSILELKFRKIHGLSYRMRGAHSEWKKIPRHTPDLPKQNNAIDCGLYVLKYTQLVALKPEKLHISGEMANFTGRDIRKLRSHIAKLLIELSENKDKE